MTFSKSTQFIAAIPYRCKIESFVALYNPELIKSDDAGQ